jgi:hypothetical protein
MDWVQILLPSLLPSLLLVIGGIVGFIVRSRTEEYRAVREKLREEQRSVYRKLLEPYIKVFSSPNSAGLSQAVQKVKSYEYKETVFDLILLGSDETIQAYNTLRKYVYTASDAKKVDKEEFSRLWGNLLLEIRKSLGYRNTKLKEKDLLQAMSKDMDKYL